MVLNFSNTFINEHFTILLYKYKVERLSLYLQKSMMKWLFIKALLKLFLALF